MAERRYSMAEITGVIGAALKALPAADRTRAERLLFLFMDKIVAGLKVLAEKR